MNCSLCIPIANLQAHFEVVFKCEYVKQFTVGYLLFSDFLLNFFMLYTKYIVTVATVAGNSVNGFESILFLQNYIREGILLILVQLNE